MFDYYSCDGAVTAKRLELPEDRPIILSWLKRREAACDDSLVMDYGDWVVYERMKEIRVMSSDDFVKEFILCEKSG